MEDSSLVIYELVFNDEQVQVIGYEHHNEIGATCVNCGQIAPALLEVLRVFDESCDDITETELDQQIAEVVGSYNNPRHAMCGFPKRITLHTVFVPLAPSPFN